ncbi:Helix-turn-helix domain-containing protein [Desulfotomaculum arcticum]|uniref:Helix-turn-helix domain-containing protein n=1 Tax=Desulfotruncus arcticus DSM 17038 TaxID=1121424 RepID=A0A1I2ZRC7_9FIRM|nr:helix-turn-helix domain-containing protein [Desulfotruncus arcticus]SFH40304.1 Helix-turn-helix domain-containing protein [Desulfotomaculum arcticum] [Desulfotruncus arcticus DSM 17038]
MGKTQICPICKKPYEYIEFDPKKDICNLFTEQERRNGTVVRLPKCMHYTVKEASRTLFLSEATIRNYCQQGRIELAVKIGKKWYIRYDLILKRSEDFQPEAEDGYFPNDGYFDGEDQKAGRDFWSNNSISNREFAEMNEYLFTAYEQ